jgi:nucleoside-diphosphate-sugar epimerase
VPTAFVLGGTGQIGQAVCQRFTAARWEVVAGARGVRPPPLSEAQMVHLDRDEPGALEAALGDGVDVLIDVIAFTVRHAEQVNGLAGRVGSVIAISSASVYADEQGRTLDEASDLASFPELPVPIPETQRTVDPGEQSYSTRKVAMERGLLAGPIPATIVRPCAIHGPGAATLREWYFVKRVLDGRRVVLLPDRGSSRFHTTSVPNLAELIFLAAEQPADRVLNCGDPDPPTVLEIERAIAAALDYEWSEVLLEKNGYDVPPAADTPWSTVRPFIVEMTEAERVIGYHPIVRYAEAVPDTVSWLVEATQGRDWRDVLPDAVRHMENSFDYSQEDAVLTDLLASRT